MLRKIAVIIPCYKSSESILKVISKIPSFVSKIYIVDDKCPQKTGYLVKKKLKKNKKINVIFNLFNGGVGFAMKKGFKKSLKDKMDISVKIDSDGQMNPKLISKFINPIINSEFEYTKGNRFFNIKNLKYMPIHRLLGNIFFSMLAKISTKNFNIFDFHNGYIAIKNSVLNKINYKSLDNSFFFETHLLFRLKKKNIKIGQINMIPVYKNEISNLNELKVGFQFLINHLKLIMKLKR